MSKNTRTLILADADMGEQLSARLDNADVVCYEDPYDLLSELAKQRCSIVILTAPRPDFAGLCRASRRLQADVRLLAICPPSAEPEIKDLTREVLDEYFIYPPTDADIARILASAPQVAIAPLDAGQAILTPRQYSELVTSARSVTALETYICELVSAQLDSPVEWINAADLPPNTQPLLQTNTTPPHALVARRQVGVSPAGQAERFLESLRQLLPALISTAQRTQGLHQLAITDHLTGAYNRRYFYHATERILARAAKENFRVTLLLYDIDNFKQYNDKYGHAAGDEILRETAAMMKLTSRPHDIIARIGGDEFAVLFWDSEPLRSPDSQPPDTAFALARRFCTMVAQHEFPSLGPDAVGTLTISGGLAAFPHDGTTCRQLLRNADARLKKVKRTGKNAIRIIGDPTELETD